MATELIMPTVPGNQTHEPQSDYAAAAQRPQHMRSLSYQVPASAKQVSPLSTSGEDQRSSMPSSPKSHYSRQNRPMYMPAVLRPNSDFVQNSAQGSGGHSPGSDGPGGRRNSNSGSLMNVPGLAAIQRLSRRSTGESAKDFGGELNLELFPAVTDVPTRGHWKPDPESTICDEPTCKRGFNYFVRRHHCRRCGNIFCDQHSLWEVPLDQDANYNPRAVPSRTCNHCFEQYKVWHTRNNSHSSSSASSDAQHATPPTPVAAPRGPALTLAKSPDAAASVPRDWNWSTF